MDDRTSDEPTPPGLPKRPSEEALTPGHAPEAVQTLRDAMRRARVDDAERASVLSDLRATRIGRLEILQDALRPLVAQIPADCDLFDIALTAGPSPRLFIDMIGFVEMGRDARTYHFFQDTRHGRVKLAESPSADMIVDAVTDYVARRLLERDKALAADAADAKPRDAARTVPQTAAVSTRPAPAPARGGPVRWAGIAFAFVIDLLGSIVFFSILAWAGWLLYNRLHGRV